ncbi:MAG: diguanylate cyclase [Campylobacterota bacterium]|nr:diguanylate cyclase [Campylobacterota bacterium]
MSFILLFITLYILNKNYLKITKELDSYIYILDNIKDSIFVIDLLTHQIVFANKNAQQTLGYSKKELLNIRLEQFSIPFNVGDDLICTSSLEAIKKSHDSFIKRAYNRAKDGCITPVEISFSYVTLDNHEYLVSICHSINEKLKLEQKDKANAKIINRYIPISHTDLKGTITYINDAFCKLTGYEQYELLGQNHRILKDPTTKEIIYHKLWENISHDHVWNGVMKNIRKDGRVIWANVTIESMYDSFKNKIGYISTREDISDKKELEYISRHDPLTGAKNRRYFEQKLQTYIESDTVFGLIMFDIDHFKLVNDTYGHHIGDLVLKNLAKNIHNTISNDNICARWGGEEFIILAPSIDTIDGLEKLTEQLQEAIKKSSFKPVKRVTSSFGLTLSLPDDTNESIQTRADKALYKAKENGRDRYEVL